MNQQHALPLKGGLTSPAISDVTSVNSRRKRFCPGFDLRSRTAKAFTLVELLAVMGVILVLVALIVPVIRGIKGAGDITKAAYDVSGAIETARSYAIANNTYAWVGFYEENFSSLTATADKPAYKGVGRVLIAVVASKDGTMIVDDNTGGSVTLDPLKISQVNKLLKIEGIHLMDIDKPPDAPPAGVRADSLDARSGLPYSYPTTGDPSKPNRIRSDGTETTSRPFAAQGYTFYKTIRFNPRGESVIDTRGTTTAAIDPARRVVEIGLRPTKGTVVDTTSPNTVAIQITGTSGSVSIYRR